MPRNITVTFADGSQHIYQNAPDDVTPEQVEARAQKDFGKPIKALDGGRQPKKTIADRADGRVATGARSFVNSGLAGWGDNITAAANAVLPLDRLTGRKESTMYGEGFLKAYHENLARERAQSATDAKAHPYTAMAGDIGGVVASPLNKIAAPIKGAGAVARAGRILAPAMAYGAAEGAHGGNAMQRLKHAGTGALESAAGAVIGDRIGAGARKVLAPKFSKAVQSLLDKGVRLTPGDMAGGAVKTAEDKLMSLPGVGALIKNAKHQSLEDWNRAIYNKVLEPVKATYEGKEVGNEGIEKVESLLNQGYERLLPKLKFKPDGTFVADVQKLLTSAKELPQDASNQLRAIIENRVAPRLGATGKMDGRTYKQLESELGTFARKYSSSADAGQRELSARIRDLVGAMRSNLERSNKAYAPTLKRLNQSWAAFTRLRDAASRRATSGGLITPGDLLAAAKKGDRSAGKGAFARGAAMMQKEAKEAHEVLPSKIPNSGTADRAAGIGALIESPHILAGVAAHPIGAAAAGAAAGLYTKPGMNALKALATKGSPKARNALAKLVRKAATRSGQYLGPHAAQQLLGGGF